MDCTCCTSYIIHGTNGASPLQVHYELSCTSCFIHGLCYTWYKSSFVIHDTSAVALQVQQLRYKSNSSTVQLSHVVEVEL
jgi:hypothetical protein